MPKEQHQQLWLWLPINFLQVQCHNFQMSSCNILVAIITGDFISLCYFSCLETVMLTIQFVLCSRNRSSSQSYLYEFTDTVGEHFWGKHHPDWAKSNLVSGITDQEAWLESALAVQTLRNCAGLYLLRKLKNLGSGSYQGPARWNFKSHTKGHFNHQSLSK